ncbi:EAL domain-containing protein [Periweissella beninensis]|nr:EAL domain-containing protein [Periweissella beninensis]
MKINKRDRIVDAYIDNWYLVRQPIWQVTKKDNLLEKELLFSELLLRSRKDGRFPVKEFQALIATPDGNQQFFAWLTGQLEKLFQAEPTIKVSVNIEPTQLLTIACQTFLQAMLSYQTNLYLEITERLSLNLSVDVFKEQLHMLKQLGYQVLLDDVDILLKNKIYLTTFLADVAGIKFSADLHQTCKHTPKAILNSGEYQNLVSKLNDKLVIGEGMSDQHELEFYLANGVYFQQGWLLGTGY